MTISTNMEMHLTTLHHHFLDPTISQAFPKYFPSFVVDDSTEDNWEDQAKRRLGQVHRRTQLALDLMGDEDFRHRFWLECVNDVNAMGFLVSKKVAHPITKLHIIYVMDDVDLSHFSG
jgi:hypothetical protein